MAMKREYHKWYSPNLSREMEILVFGESGSIVVVFPTRTGRFFDYENFGMVDALKDSINQGHLQLYCVDSIDEESVYCNWNFPGDRIKRHLQYEKYIIDEIIPFALKKNFSNFIISHGCSMGAWHAMNIALKHPDVFGKIVALSGRYDLTSHVGSFRGLFDGYYDETIYFNNPSHFVPNIADAKWIELLKKMQIVFVVGLEDAFIENNRHLSQAFHEKGIGHAYYEWEGEAHKPRYWRNMVQLYL